MKVQEIQERLAGMGFQPDRYALEPFGFRTRYGPPGALDAIRCYRLIDKKYHRQFDVVSRDWEPVLVLEDAVLTGPSPEMFTRLLEAGGYFDRAEGFKDTLVFQLHRFALDFYDGYEVREEALERGEDEVTVRGRATRGTGMMAQSAPFATRVIRGKTAEFLPQVRARKRRSAR